jgi:hypothetical protein
MKEEKQPEARSEVAPAKNETTEKTEFSTISENRITYLKIGVN